MHNVRQFVNGRDAGAPLRRALNQVSIKGVKHCKGCGATGETACKEACAPPARRRLTHEQASLRNQCRAADAQGPARKALVELLAPLQARSGVHYCFEFNKTGACTRDGCNYFPCCKKDSDEVKAAYARAGL